MVQDAIWRSPFAARMGRQLTFTGEEADFLDTLPVQHLSVRPGGEILAAGERCRWLYLMLDGWSCRQKLLEDGRRQIVHFFLAGDMIGAHDLFRRRTAGAVTALSAASLARIEERSVKEMRQRFPRLAGLLFRAAAREHAILLEHAVRLGRHSAYERVVHLLLEFSDRLRAAGLPGDDYRLPLTQEELADSLGLSLVHINRTLQRLRREELIRLASQRVTLLDRARLADIAGYDPAYLDEAAPGG